MVSLDNDGESPDITVSLNQYLLQSIFHHCRFRNEVAVVDTLVNHPDHVHNVLRAASIFGWEDMALTAIANGADIYYAPPGQNNAFHNAIMRGHTNIMQHFINMDPRILNTLNGHGFSALRNAVQHGHLPAVNLLIQYGANIYTVDDIDGGTPLNDARAIGGEVANRLEIMSLLLTDNNINRDIYQNGEQVSLEDMLEIASSMVRGSEISVSSGFLSLLGALFITDYVC